MKFSSHLCLGLPLGLVVKGFYLNIYVARQLSFYFTTIFKFPAAS